MIRSWVRASVLFAGSLLAPFAQADDCTPSLVSQLVESAEDVAASGDFVYLASGKAGLTVVDLSSPGSPAVVASVDIPTLTTQVAVSGSFVYTAGIDGLLRVFDVSTPSVPIARGTHTVFSQHQVEALEVVGTTAYMVAFSDFSFQDFRTLSVADPDNPAALDGLSLDGEGYDVAISGPYAYIAEGTNGLRVVDVSDPSNISHVTTIPMMAEAHHVAVSGDTVIVADNDLFEYLGGYHLIDVTDPLNPADVFYTDATGFITDIAADASAAYISGDFQIDILDVSVPSVPVDLGIVYWSGEQPYAIDVDSSTLYQARQQAGLVVTDVSDPSAPSTVADIDPGITAGHRVLIDGDVAYVASIGRLWTVDVSDPSNPTVLGTLGGLGGAPEIALYGDTLYYDTRFSGIGLRIIDVSDPAHPVNLGRLAGTHGSPTVHGGRLYTKSGFDYVIHDLTSPTAPSQIGSFTASSTFGGQLAVSGGLAASVSLSNGIELYDVSDPMNAGAITTLPTPGFTRHVQISGDHIYIADGNAGLHVVDASNPATPSIIATVDTPSNAYRVLLDGAYAYVADFLGLVLIDIANPASPSFVVEFRNFGVGDQLQPNDAGVIDGLAFTPTSFNGFAIVDMTSCIDEQSCPGDLTTTGGSNPGVPDGVTDLSDLLYFVNLWNPDVGTPSPNPSSLADITTTGGTNPGVPDGNVDLSDLLYFVNGWTAGRVDCP